MHMQFEPVYTKFFSPKGVRLRQGLVYTTQDNKLKNDQQGPHKSSGGTQVLAKGKQLLLPIRHPPCYWCIYIPVGQSKKYLVGDLGKNRSTISNKSLKIPNG